MGGTSTIGRHASGVKGIGVVAMASIVASVDTLGGTEATMRRGDFLRGVNETALCYRFYQLRPRFGDKPLGTRDG